jgi:hypothetical protein
MTRISDYYNLGLTQESLDFIDVDIVGDTKVFVDPTSLLIIRSDWGSECVALLQDFFRTVLDHIHSGNDHEARRLLSSLREPNETHLGFSRDRARGRALGRESARDVWESLSRSEAVQSGLLEDLEDTILMVEGIAFDIVSDITTNIIRQPLIHYTQIACQEVGIPLRTNVDSGPLWDMQRKEWFNEFTDLPVASYGKLLLVPKIIVRRKMTYDADEYYRDFLLPFLQEYEISAGSALVQVLKNGRPRVTKKSVMEKYGRGKSIIVRETRNHPEVLRQYRIAKRSRRIPAMSLPDLSETIGAPEPDLPSLVANLETISAGNESADEYHRAVEAFLTALFYPALVNPQNEFPIHEGRKRVDIVFTNSAVDGFFQWLSDHYPAAHVFVECKNYSGDPGNPELDQLAGRFSPSRGTVGLLICRTISEKDRFVARCRDTAQDNRGFIIPLDDEDLRVLAVAGRDYGYSSRQYDILKRLFDRLIM